MSFVSSSPVLLGRYGDAVDLAAARARRTARKNRPTLPTADLRCRTPGLGSRPALLKIAVAHSRECVTYDELIDALSRPPGFAPGGLWSAPAVIRPGKLGQIEMEISSCVVRVVPD